MKIFHLVILASSLLFKADGAVYSCGPEPCVQDFEDSCEAVIEIYEFSGSCCSLTETNGTCSFVTTSDCTFQVKGDTGCVQEEDGSLSCVPAFTEVTSTLEGVECPESDFPDPTILEGILDVEVGDSNVTAFNATNSTDDGDGEGAAGGIGVDDIPTAASGRMTVIISVFLAVSTTLML